MAQKKLTCPECWSDKVEKIALASQEGNEISNELLLGIANLFQRLKFKKVINSKNADNIFFYKCATCNYYEVWNVTQKNRLFKKYHQNPEPQDERFSFRFQLSSKAKQMLYGIIIGGILSTIAFYWLFSIAFEGYFTDNLFGFTSFTPGAHLTIFAVIVIYLGLTGIFSYVILAAMDKRIQTQEFTLQLHQVIYGKHLYYLEHNAKAEKTAFSDSLKRAFYGTILILGIYILIIENFLIIPDLKPVFWDASNITLLSLIVALPFIIIFFYISPLLNKEVNLYYFDKGDRIVKNVGSWLDEALHFFAAVDILLTMIIILDSNLELYWFGIIFSFVLLVFVFFMVFTLAFNQFYHERLKEKYIQYLKGKYNLPIRKASVFQQNYYCRQCGNLTDHVQHDTCQTCDAKLYKCMICNEIVDLTNIVGKTVKGFKPAEQPQISSLINRMENRMAGSPGKEYPAIQCPNCGELAHLDEFISWLKLRETCPNCKEKLNFFDLF